MFANRLGVALRKSSTAVGGGGKREIKHGRAASVSLRSTVALGGVVAAVVLLGGARSGNAAFMSSSAAASSSSAAAAAGAVRRELAEGHPKPVVLNNTPKATAVMLITHGLGDTADGWLDIAEELAEQLPHVKFVLPTAKTQPVTLNGGERMPSWYDIVGLQSRATETCDGIEDSREYLTELARVSMPPGVGFERLILGGFSQGGAMSIYTGLQLQEAIAGVVSLSGYLPNARKFRVSEQAKKTPVFMAHGTHDGVVQYTWALDTEKEIRDQGVESVTFKTYRGMGHSAVPEEIRDLFMFVKARLPPIPVRSEELR